MEPVAPVVQARWEASETTEGERQRSLEALEAAARFAIRLGSIGRLDMLGNDNSDGRGAPLLTLRAGCYPAPSMLAELLAALSRSDVAAVEARQLPFDGSPRPCRLAHQGTGSAVMVPSAVAFCDHHAASAGRPIGRPAGSPFLSVLMRTQGHRPANLEEALTCLAAQTVDDFEVHLAVHHDDAAMVSQVQALVDRFSDRLKQRINVFPVVGGGRARPLNAGLERASGQYVAFLDDDDLVTADWVETFLAGSQDAPGAVVRCSSVNQRIERADRSCGAPYVEVGTPEPVFAARFDLLDHLRDNSTPIFSFAVPRALVGGERFREELPVLEDWDFFMRMVLAAGVHDTGRVTGVYHWWLSGESTLDQAGAVRWQEARRQVLRRLDEESVLLPPGSVSRLAGLMDDVADAHAQLEDARDQAATAYHEVQTVLRSRYWRVAALLRKVNTALRWRARL